MSQDETIHLLSIAYFLPMMYISWHVLRSKVGLDIEKGFEFSQRCHATKYGPPSMAWHGYAFLWHTAIITTAPELLLLWCDDGKDDGDAHKLHIFLI